ncbi:MAG TPA: hypothetical protein VF756_15125, partial [Thermoanaerobaculia bacterium]
MPRKYLPTLRLLILLPALSLLASLANCRGRRDEPVRKPPPPAQVSRFTPPPDGKLTEEQIERFLEARPREKEITDETGDPKADLRAAREVGQDPAEYQWVKARIVEAVLARITSDWDTMDAPSRRRLLEGMERVKDTIQDREDRAAVEREIARLRSSTPAPPRTEALRHNVDLVARHQEEMLRVEVWSV